MRTAHLLLTAAVVSGLAFVAPAQAAPAGVVGPAETNLTATTLDLGTLGGKNSEAVAVDGSVVVGTSRNASGESRAFAYDLAAAEPAMLDLGTLGGEFSTAEDVAGTVVVGRSRTASGRSYHAYAYDLAADEPAMLDLGTLGGEFSEAVAVDGTIVVGSSKTASGDYHAFAYDLAADEPAMLDLGTLGGDYSEAAAVDGTIVVGTADTAATVVNSGTNHAFAYDLAAAEPAMRDLGTLGGDDSAAAPPAPLAPPSYGEDVAGAVVVGKSYTASRRVRAFAYDLAAAEPAMQDLGTLGRRTGAAAVDGTTVVGSSFIASPRRSRAFAYDLAAAEPAMRDLGTVVGGASTWAMGTAIDGDVVIGRWEVPRMGSYFPFSFAYDLGADEPSMLDLGTWRGAIVADVDGEVVVGRATKGTGERATAWVLRETTRPMIAFQRFERGVKEGVGRATIRVVRSGRTDRAVTVRYRTRSDTAKAGQDFVHTSGKLRFPPGVTSRSFKVRILNDRRREKKEHLLLTLSRPSKPALLGTPSWSQLRINANDR